MRVLVTGSAGQLGWELKQTCPASAQVLWTDVAELDIGNEASVSAQVAAFAPNVVINAAAYTAVDKAESEPAIAYRINRDGAANLARSAADIGARFLHVSTDFVFDGKGSPYLPSDACAPLSVYGASKFEGELAVMAIGGASLIIRTAWVYSAHGGNFVKTMLRLMAQMPKLNVVCDQVGSPTWARGLALAIWGYAQLQPMPNGVVHYTDSGVASWYDFAVAIQEEALHMGLLHAAIPIVPIPASDYPTPAKRPGFSVLDKASTIKDLGSSPHWRVQLRSMLQQLQAQQA